MAAYQPGIPTGTVNLDVDYQNLQNNFQQLDTIFGIDHKPFSNTTAKQGYHTVVHLVEQSNTSNNPPNNQPVVAPAPVANIGELFAAEINDGIDTDTAFYFQSGKGKVMQMTRNFVPVAANNGYTFLPGGLILQWGQITSTSSSFTTLNFSTNNKAFPNNCFAIYTQVYGSGSAPNGNATLEIRKSTVSKTGFEWAFVTNSAQYTGFFWAAIGN